MKKKQLVGVISIFAGAFALVYALSSMVGVAMMIPGSFHGNPGYPGFGQAFTFLIAAVLYFGAAWMLVIKHEMIAGLVCGKSADEEISAGLTMTDILEVVLILAGLSLLGGFGEFITQLYYALFPPAGMLGMQPERNYVYVVGMFFRMVIGVFLIIWRVSIAKFLIRYAR